MLFGVALVVAAVAGPQVSVDGNSVGPGTSWWQRAVLVGVGVVVVAWAVLASRESLPVLRTGRGFVGAPPRVPVRLVRRQDLLQMVVDALHARERTVALAGIGGAGKSTLAAQACGERGVRREFRDGIIWLEAGPGRDPVVLLADLARLMGLPGAAAGFVTTRQGRDVLAAALRDKRILLAVDNVWDSGPLNALIGLAGTCTVLFTTRLPELATTVSAALITVDKLTQDEALDLLNAWTGPALAVLPEEAQRLCTRLGDLALGVAMAGAMIARGRSVTDVLDLIAIDLARIQAELDPAYPYRTLFAAIEAGVADLPAASQHLYAQLAVFADHGTFPRAAAAALWQPKLTGAEAGDLLAELTGRSLLAATGDSWYTAHDLQYEDLTRRLGPAALAAAHARLLDGYRARYTGGWAASAADPYLARALIGHLRDAGLDTELQAVLTDHAWIQTRLTQRQLPDLISDYRHTSDPLARQVMQALLLSAPALTADPSQARGQLAGRLMNHPDPVAAAWARDQAGHPSARPWLMPLTPALTPTTSPLQQTLQSHGGMVLAVAVTADGTTAVSGGDDALVRVWDLATSRQQAALTGHKGAVRAVAVTADGTTAVSGGEDGSVRVWDLATSRQQAALTGHKGTIWAVAVTADGTTAVTGGEDRSVRVWDLATSRQRAALTGHKGTVRAVAVTADGTTAVSGGEDGSVRVWDLATSRQRAALTSDHGIVIAMAVSADGTTAVISHRGFEVQVWDLVAGRQQATLRGQYGGTVWPVAVTADGTTAVTGSSDGSVRVWDLPTNREQAILTGHDFTVLAAAISTDGTTAVTGGYDGSVRVWDLATSRQQAPPTDDDGTAVAAAFSADGMIAVTSGGLNGVIRVWDLADGRQQAALTGHHGTVWAVAVTADGTTAVTDGGTDGVILVWDLADGRQRATLTGHIGYACALAVSADGTTAVAGDEYGNVRVWDLATNGLKAVLTGHKDRVCAVAVSADGTTAVSGGYDGYLRVWDLAGGRQQAALTDHQGTIWAVAVTADGTTAVTGSNDGSVRVWDLAGGRQQAALPGHKGTVHAVAVTADGTTVVSGSGLGAVRVWDLATQAEVARWDGDYVVVGCATLPGLPLRIVVGQYQGQPYLLELKGQQPR